MALSLSRHMMVFRPTALNFARRDPHNVHTLTCPRPVMTSQGVFLFRDFFVLPPPRTEDFSESITNEPRLIDVLLCWCSSSRATNNTQARASETEMNAYGCCQAFFLSFVRENERNTLDTERRPADIALGVAITARSNQSTFAPRGVRWALHADATW